MSTLASKDRDFDTNPYSPDEKRVADYFNRLGIGGGDDPIGYLIASNGANAFQASLAKKEAARYRKVLEEIEELATDAPTPADAEDACEQIGDICERALLAESTEEVSTASGTGEQQ